MLDAHWCHASVRIILGVPTGADGRRPCGTSSRLAHPLGAMAKRCLRFDCHVLKVDTVQRIAGLEAVRCPPQQYGHCCSLSRGGVDLVGGTLAMRTVGSVQQLVRNPLSRSCRYTAAHSSVRSCTASATSPATSSAFFLAALISASALFCA